MINSKSQSQPDQSPFLVALGEGVDLYEVESSFNQFSHSSASFPQLSFFVNFVLLSTLAARGLTCLTARGLTCLAARGLGSLTGLPQFSSFQSSFEFVFPQSLDCH